MSNYAELRALTDLTGAQADVDRPVVVGTVELSLPFVKAGLLGALPAVIVGGLLGAAGGMIPGLVAALVVWGLLLWLLLGASAAGLRQRNLNTLRDRLTYRDADVTLCGHPIDPAGTEVGFVARNTVPVRHPASDTDTDVVLGLAGRVTRSEVDVAAFNLPAVVMARGRRRAHTARSMALTPQVGATTPDPADLFCPTGPTSTTGR